MSTADGSPALPVELVERVRQARRIAVLTGAGISAESGVPTFREAQTGLWARYDPMELATPEAFQRDPALVWRWYAWRRSLVAAVEPNAGHRALARLEDRCEHFLLATQNVDGLHRRAGSRRVVELHGRLDATRCFDCAAPAERWDETQSPPLCEACGGWLRPGVVWFGEALPAEPLARALEAARGCDLFLCIGTSALVQPAASLPFEALRAGAAVVEVNPVDTPLTQHASHVLTAPAGVALPALLEASARGGA